MRFQSNDSGEQVVLILEGELTIQFAGELKTLLLQVVEKSEVILDLNAVTAMDLSAMQLLCSLHRTMLKSSRRVSVAGGVPASLAESLAEAGFLRDLGCSLDTDGTCLWLKGGTPGE
jgi:anti-anti-sigma factor